MANPAILIRTHKMDLQTEALVRGLQEVFGKSVYVVYDATNSRPNFDFCNVIEITNKDIASWQFTNVPRNWGWLCGDFFYYPALDRLPDYDSFCLIENDVVMSHAAIERLKGILVENVNSAMACDLKRHDSIRMHSHGLTKIGVDPHWGCQFPVSVMRREQIELMRAVRREALVLGNECELNDEAVFAATVVRHDLSFKDLYSFGDVFSPDKFSTHPPFVARSDKWVPDDAFAYHPVIPLSKILNRIRTGERSYTHNRMQKTIRRRSPRHIGASIQRAIIAKAADAVEQTTEDNKGKTDRLGKLLSILPTYEPIRILDIGANPIEGTPEYGHLLSHGQCTVVGFEPQKTELDILNARKGPNETYLPHAVGKDGPAKLHIARHSGFSSLYPPDLSAAAFLNFSRGMQITSTVDLTVVSLDSIAEIGAIDLLKMDIQGGELAVLGGASNLLSDAIAVQTEARMLPIYEGEPSFGQLHDALMAKEFCFHTWLFQKRVKTSHRYRKLVGRGALRQMVDGDAAYVARLTRLDKECSVRLSKLAVMADSVFDSPDLAFHCLSILANRGELTDADAFEYAATLPPIYRRGL